MSSVGALASSPFVGLEVPLVEGGSGDLDVGGAFGVAREPVGRAPGRVLGFGEGLWTLEVLTIGAVCVFWLVWRKIFSEGRLNDSLGVLMGVHLPRILAVLPC